MADIDDLERTKGVSPFRLAGGGRQLIAHGMQRQLVPGPADTLGQRTQEFFREERDAQAPAMLVGALPFDRRADDFLFQPESVSRLAFSPIADEPPPMALRWRVSAEPERAAYEKAVSRALEIIAGAGQAGGLSLEKIVLSRSLLLEADIPVDVVALFRRLLGDPGAFGFLTWLGNGADGVSRYLTGATPELLLSKKGADIVSRPLAGSTPRSPDPAEDIRWVEALKRSGKDQREHRWVVEAILDGLAPYCSALSAPDSPELVSTLTMWHLGTQIVGRLKHPQDVSAAELAAVLHPTPAVGGTPRDRALELIPQLEGYDRGFYAGAVGWVDGSGDGEWYVSLRCAEIEGRIVRVCAGAGIVEGSVPAREADETSAKLQAILMALGVEEDGRMRPAVSAVETAC